MNIKKPEISGNIIEGAIRGITPDLRNEFIRAVSADMGGVDTPSPETSDDVKFGSLVLQFQRNGQVDFSGYAGSALDAAQRFADMIGDENSTTGAFLRANGLGAHVDLIDYAAFGENPEITTLVDIAVAL